MRIRNDTSVLLVEDNAGDATVLQELLLDASGSSFTIQWATRLSQGLEWIQRQRFDVVLLDLTLSGCPGLEAFARLREAAPQVPVIVLTDRPDDQVALRTVRAGADEYLVKNQISADALGRSVQCAVERNSRRRTPVRTTRSRDRKRSRVVGFLGAKGGVGTTTVALNVAAAMAENQRNVLAVEFRGTYGTMAAHLGEFPTHSNISSVLALAPEQINEVEVHARVVKYSSNLGLLLSPQRASELKPFEAAQAEALMRALTNVADTVVLDLPQGPLDVVSEAVRRCDFLGLVLDREEICISSSRVLLNQMRQWGATPMVGLVVVHRSPLACPVDLSTITGQLGHGILELIPPAADSCLMAVKAGVPLVDCYQDALIGSALRELAGKLAADPIVIRKIA